MIFGLVKGYSADSGGSRSIARCAADRRDLKSDRMVPWLAFRLLGVFSFCPLFLKGGHIRIREAHHSGITEYPDEMFHVNSGAFDVAGCARERLQWLRSTNGRMAALDAAGSGGG